MNVPQKPNIGRCKEARKQSCASEIAMEAIAQAQRQIEFERARKDAIIKGAREELLACEQRMTTLAKHVADLRELAGQYESLAA